MAFAVSPVRALVAVEPVRRTRAGELVRLRSRDAGVFSPGVPLPERIGRWIVRAVGAVRRLGRRLRRRFGRRRPIEDG